MSAVAQDLKPFARILDVSEERYHSDPCEVPSLSQSIAHRLVAFSPLHAWQAHPRLGKMQLEEPESDTRAKIDGKVVHRLLLGKGAEIVVCPFNDFRTNAAKAMRDEAVLNGKVPVIEHRFAEAAAVAEILGEKIAALGYAFDGQSEVAFEWDEQGEKRPVRCRGRLDHLRLGADFGQILDVKKIRSAHPLTIAKHMYEYGYDIQWCAYTSAVSKFRPDLESVLDMVFLFVEMEAPYAVVPVQMSQCLTFMEIGRRRWEDAIIRWERCIDSNRWPEYANGPIAVEPPKFVVDRELGDWGSDITELGLETE